MHIWSPDSSSNQNPAHFQLVMEATVMVKGLVPLCYLVSSYMERAGIYPLYSMPLGIWGLFVFLLLGWVCLQRLREQLAL